MSSNFTDLDDLHERFTADGIEHHYTYGVAVITVFHGDHAWTVSGDCIIYWGASTYVCKTRCHEIAWIRDAYDYIADVYSKAQ